MSNCTASRDCCQSFNTTTSIFNIFKHDTKLHCYYTEYNSHWSFVFIHPSTSEKLPSE